MYIFSLKNYSFYRGSYSNISLVRPTYYKLKEAIKEKHPEKTHEVYRKHMKHKTRRKFINERNKGTLCTDKTRFSKLEARS